MPPVELEELLCECVARGGTELYILPGRAPHVSPATAAADGGELLTAEQARDLLVRCMPGAQRTVFEIDGYVRWDCLVTQTDGTPARFRCLVWRSNGYVSGAFSVFDPATAAPTEPDATRDALLQVIGTIDRRYRDAGWELPAGDLDLPGPGDARWNDPGGYSLPPGGSGGAPVPAVRGPAEPTRAGADAKPLPTDDAVSDDNLHAQ